MPLEAEVARDRPMLVVLEPLGMVNCASRATSRGASPHTSTQDPAQLIDQVQPTARHRQTATTVMIGRLRAHRRSLQAVRLESVAG